MSEKAAGHVPVYTGIPPCPAGTVLGTGHGCVFFVFLLFFETTKNTFMKLKKEVEKKEMGKGEALPQWNN